MGMRPGMRIISFSKGFYHRLSHFCGGFGHKRSCMAQRVHFTLCCPFSSRDNRSSVPHSAAWWSCDACDKSGNGLGAVMFDPFCGLIFRAAPDLSDEQYALCFGVILKEF